MRPFITSFGMICTGATYHLHITKRLKQKNKEIHLPRLPKYEAATIWCDKHILWQGRASVVLIFVLVVLAILSNESIDNMPFQLCMESKFLHKCSKLSLQLMPLWMLLTHINAFGALLSCFFSIFRAKIWIMYEVDNALRHNVALLCCSFQSFLKIFLIHKAFAVKLMDGFWHLTYNSRPCALSIAIQKVNNLSGSHTFGKHTVRHLRVVQPHCFQFDFLQHSC